MPQLTSTNAQPGFQSLVSQRATMHQWSHLRNLLNIATNREAIAIVQSFENQLNMELATETCSAN